MLNITTLIIMVTAPLAFCVSDDAARQCFIQRENCCPVGSHSHYLNGNQCAQMHSGLLKLSLLRGREKSDWCSLLLHQSLFSLALNSDSGSDHRKGKLDKFLLFLYLKRFFDWFKGIVQHFMKCACSFSCH